MSAALRQPRPAAVYQRSCGAALLLTAAALALGADPGWPAWLPLVLAIALTGVALIATAQYAVNRPAQDD